MRRKMQRAIHLLTVTAVVLSVVGIAPAGASFLSSRPAETDVARPAASPAEARPAAQTATVASSAPAQAGGPTSVETASDAALAKLDEDLVALARKGGEEIVDLRIVVAGEEAAWPDFVQAVPRAQPDEASGLPVWYGQVKASHLAKLAGLDFVVHADYNERVGPVPRFRDPDDPGPQVTEEMRARLRALRDNPPASNLRPEPQGWWDIGPGHESKKAWDKGYTGAGVRVADIDSGVDFCHPDLYGTWATYNVSASRNITYSGVVDYYTYFDGWPTALSPFSNYALFFDLWYNGAMTNVNTFAYGASKFADTSATGAGDTISFGGDDYLTTGTADPANPVYHIGYHPDTSLENLWWGERIAVLVVDEDGDGVYETVYVDLNNNKDFTDDEPASQADPTACWDADGDGYNDLSGGLVYFISDGLHWPQMMDWWFNPGAFFAPPGSGDLVAFMFDDILGPAAAHGTLTAGNIVGQGRADGDPSVFGGEARPYWKPAGVGGMIQGGGRDAKLIAIGDSYILFTSSTEEAYYFSYMGVDGYGDTDDGAQITSNSYGESEVDNDEWDNRSRLVTRLNTRTTYRGFPAIYNQRVAHVDSTGNGAPGYGTTAPPNASTAIQAGASTQTGSTHSFELISGSDQVVWGDVMPWSNRGPTAVGHLAPHVTGDGAWGAGAITSNGWGDGWSAWGTWGGTSRSAPVIAGNLALIYQAWQQRTGQWPTWSQARELVMNGATDQMYDVLTQGAGAVNSDRSTNIAGGLYGLNVSPDSWYPGTSPGATGEPIAFAQVIQPGGTDSQVFTAWNYSPLTITASLTATYLTRISSREFVVTATAANESAYSVSRPDYLFNVSQYAPGGAIPADTDLMVAEIIHPFDEFEPQGDNVNGNNNLWRLLWYSWKDVDGDGKLWTDANANGAVNAGEQETGEFVRFAYGYGAHTYRQVAVKDPLNPDRWKNGIYLGLQHRQRRNTEVPASHLRIRVTYYKKSAWPWLSFNASNAAVNPNSSAAFTVTANVPANAPYGVHEGAVEVGVPAQGAYAAYTSIVPVVINVAFSGDVAAAPITLGGQPKANTPYDNGYVSGSQDWTWRAESGDWRFYFLNQTVTPTLGTRLVVRDEWGDAAPETDIDTLVLGPTSGAYTRLQPPFNFNFGDFSTADPATFGPYRLEVLAKSERQYLGSGIWDFQTVTGGNVEYVIAPMTRPGLHEVLQHTVRYEGAKFEVPFTKTLSTLTGPTALAYTNYFTDLISFGANITHTNGLTVEVYGLSDTRQDFTGLSIEQDPTNGNNCDFAAGGIYTYTTTLAGNVARFTAHVTVGANDLDLFLLYDVDGDGFDCPADTIASSTRSAGQDDEVTVNFPAAGNYMVVIQGWSVIPSPSPFSWYFRRTDLDATLAARNLSLSIGPGKNATFELYNVNPAACSHVTAECNDGIIYVGFPNAPRLFSIPITVNYDLAANLSTSTKKVNAATAGPLDVLTYTLSLTNSSTTVVATGARLTDTLPSGVTFDSIVSGGATYNSGLNAVLWNGNIPTSSVQTIVYRAMVGNVPDGTVIANTADVNNGAGNVRTIGPANTVVDGIDLSASSKAVDKAAAARDEELTYTLVVRNTGAVEALGALLTDTLPANTTYVAASATGGAVYSPTLNAILWSQTFQPGSSTLLLPGGAYTVTYKAKLNTVITNTTVITNYAWVDDGFGNTSQTNVASTTVVKADLGNSSKQASSSVVKQGDVVTFTILIRNTGLAATGPAMMVDTLPISLTRVSAPTVSGPGSVVFSGSTITWTGTLQAGFTDTQAEVRVAAQVNSLPVCASITNTANLNDGQGGTYQVSAVIGGLCVKVYMPIIFKNATP